MQINRHREDGIAGERLDERAAVEEEVTDGLQLEAVEIVEEEQQTV